jgi:RHS repeat-associated protein
VYDAFGRIIAQTGNTVNSYLFAGQQRDAGTGLDYLRARYMDTDLGSFISRDPFPSSLSSPQTLHRYVYARSNPTNDLDPSGLEDLESLSTALAVGAILSGIQNLSGLYLSDSAGIHGTVTWDAALISYKVPSAGGVSVPGLGSVSAGISGGVSVSVLTATSQSNGIDRFAVASLLFSFGIEAQLGISGSSSFGISVTTGTLDTPGLFAVDKDFAKIAFAGFTTIISLSASASARIGASGTTAHGLGVSFSPAVVGFGSGNFNGASYNLQGAFSVSVGAEFQSGFSDPFVVASERLDKSVFDIIETARSSVSSAFSILDLL